MRTSLALAALVAALVPSCVYDDDGVSLAETVPLRAALERRTFLPVEATTAVSVDAATDGVMLAGVEPQVTGGRAVLRATDTGLLLVEALEVSLGDATLPGGTVGPRPLRLSELELRLGTQLVVEPTWGADGISVTGAARADLLFDMALVDASGTYPLGSQILRDQPFTLRADLDGDVIRVHLETTADGTVSNIAGRIVLSDFAMAVDASSAKPIAEPL